MGAAAAVMGGLSLAQGFAGSELGKIQSRAEASQLEQNAKLAKMKAEDSIRRGEEDAESARRQGKQVIGAQRAIFGAQGIELSSGSALDVQGDTAAQAEIDAITIRNNAFMEAMGYKTQAKQLKTQAKLTRSFGQTQANLSLLGGGIGAVGSAYKAGGR